MKININTYERIKLIEFLEIHKPDFMENFYTLGSFFKSDSWECGLNKDQIKWIVKNCPFQFVKDKIEREYE
jgi:hypothetical protein